MIGLFSVVAIDGEFTDFLNDLSMPYLRYDSLTWKDAVQLCELSFAQGFQCVIWKLDDGNDTSTSGGADDGEKHD